MPSLPICSICFESLLAAASSVEVGCLPCGHVFHVPCLSPWVKAHYDCPQCRCPASAPSISPLFLTQDSRRGIRATSASSTASSQSSQDRAVVLDLLQTQVEDHEREVARLVKLLEQERKEKEEEAEVFHKKVQELQQRFAEVEEAVRLKEERGDEGEKEQLKVVELVRENDELREEVERRRVEVEGLLRERSEGWRARGRSEETLYESLSYQELHQRSSKGWKEQVTSCARASVLILVLISLILAVTIVLPLKILFARPHES